MPDRASTSRRLALRRGFVAVAVGWSAGLGLYAALTHAMLGRGWLVQTEPLMPAVFAPAVLAIGVVAAAAVTVGDLRRERTATISGAWSRLLVAAGAAMTGIGLVHAHAVGQLAVLGPDAVLAKDVLYHAPGIALIVAGWWARPVPGA